MSQDNRSLHELPASRFDNIQANVRSLLRGSSVYSGTPQVTPRSPPKLPSLGFLRRDNQDGPEQGQNDSSSETRRHANPSQEILPTPPQVTYSPVTYPSSESSNRSTTAVAEVLPDRHPADRPLGIEGMDLENGSVARDEEPTTERERIQDRIRRKTRRRHQRAWIRKRRNRYPGETSVMSTEEARAKILCIVISGMFLATVLTVYLSIALTRHSISQEVHVLFILVILVDTVFFCHSIIRLCMLALHGPEQRTPRIPSVVGPHGFRPNVAVRVHLARDDEFEPLDENGQTRELTDEERKELANLKQPPPAYGLWRSSVRVDPNLLHWQRVDGSSQAGSRATTPNPRSRSASPNSDAPQEAEAARPRPPSYASDDGVSYVVEAQPRSTVVSMLGPPQPTLAPSQATLAPPQAMLAPPQPSLSPPQPSVGRPMSGLSQVHPAYRR